MHLNKDAYFLLLKCHSPFLQACIWREDQQQGNKKLSSIPHHGQYDRPCFTHQQLFTDWHFGTQHGRITCLRSLGERRTNKNHYNMQRGYNISRCPLSENMRREGYSEGLIGKQENENWMIIMIQKSETRSQQRNSVTLLSWFVLIRSLGDSAWRSAMLSTRIGE